MPHKSGFVNIIGHPNVGKSTLMNQLVGEKISIITNKAQTTRHRILGIVNKEEYQIIYSDTPGIIDPAYKLQVGMMKFVKSALQDADILLLMVEVGQTSLKNEELTVKLQNINVPLIVLINKVDTITQEDVNKQIEHWKEVFKNAEVLPLSAVHGFNILNLQDRIIELLPENPPFYPKDTLTDKPEKFFVEEIIREQILIQYKQEIPYSVEVVVVHFKEEEKIIKIRADIMVARESQKGILIGKGGSRIKGVGTDARKKMQRFFEKQVFLELQVKVNKNWRDNEAQLKRFGYL